MTDTPTPRPLSVEAVYARIRELRNRVHLDDIRDIRTPLGVIVDSLDALLAHQPDALTECCHVALSADQRYCSACGWEARAQPAVAAPETPDARVRLAALHALRSRLWMACGKLDANPAMVHAYQFVINELDALLALPETERPPSFTCSARKTFNTDHHADCEWPTCGCDPYADKVIAALQESGDLKAPRVEAEPRPFREHLFTGNAKTSTCRHCGIPIGVRHAIGCDRTEDFEWQREQEEAEPHDCGPDNPACGCIPTNAEPRQGPWTLAGVKVFLEEVRKDAVRRIDDGIASVDSILKTQATQLAPEPSVVGTPPALDRARAAMIRAMDALESDAELAARREAFEMIQAEFDGVSEVDHARAEALIQTLRAPLLDAPTLRDFVFSCPACGDPNAQTVEPDVDIHSGATYRCDKCHGQVIFTAQTPEQYCKVDAPTREERATPLVCANPMSGEDIDDPYAFGCIYHEPASDQGEQETRPRGEQESAT